MLPSRLAALRNHRPFPTQIKILNFDKTISVSALVECFRNILDINKLRKCNEIFGWLIWFGKLWEQNIIIIYVVVFANTFTKHWAPTHGYFIVLNVKSIEFCIGSEIFISLSRIYFSSICFTWYMNQILWNRR